MIEAAKQRLRCSYASLARMVGVSKTTFLQYRVGKILLPRSVFNLLTELSGLDMEIRRTYPPNWGQVKGGRVAQSSEKRHVLTREEAKHMGVKGAMALRRKRMLGYRELVDRLVEGHPADLAEFVAKMLGDGSISTPPKYCASERENHEIMVSLANKLFGLKPKIKARRGYYETVFNRTVLHVLSNLGIPLGRKSITNPHFPRFIVESESRDIIVRALRGFFDDEAHIEVGRIEVSAAVRSYYTELGLTRFYEVSRSSIGCKSFMNVVGTRLLPRSRLIDDVGLMLSRLAIPHRISCRRIIFNKDSLSVEWKLVISGVDNVDRVRELGLISQFKIKGKFSNGVWPGYTTGASV